MLNTFLRSAARRRLRRLNGERNNAATSNCASGKSGRALKQEKQKHGVAVQNDARVPDVRRAQRKDPVELHETSRSGDASSPDSRGESPFHVCPRQALGYVRVIGDVVNVVIIED